MFGAHTQGQQPTYRLTRWIFLRLLGVIYLIAFVSFRSQLRGLIGSRGIVPARDFLKTIRANLGDQAFQSVPTLAWLDSSDEALLMLCTVAVLLALLVIADVLTAPALAFLWMFYLSLVYIAQPFLGYQWDVLLLECGVLAIFLAPKHPLPGLSRQRAPPRVVIWLFRLLLFRLIFESGYAKLASGDPTWRTLSAMTYHYWTQPLPSRLAWYTHRLPLWAHQIEVLLTFAVELGAPFLIFRPRRARALSAALITGHQGLIFATGNFSFFNVLTMALCVLLFDDQTLRPLFPASLRDVPPGSPSVSQRLIAGLIGGIIGTMGLVQIAEQMRHGNWVPSRFSTFVHQLDALRMVNRYRLFASMTVQRPEIIIEGSNDGVHWLPYEFKYKVGDPLRPPRRVAPSQPRLDWQMWFAALRGPQAARSGWFIVFIERLLSGTPEVLELLDKNPFPEVPPRYIRADLYDYQFTDAGTKRATGQWWQRERLGRFLPTATLRPPESDKSS